MTLNPLVLSERITPNRAKRQADELVPAVVSFFWATVAHSVDQATQMGKGNCYSTLFLWILAKARSLISGDTGVTDAMAARVSAC